MSDGVKQHGSGAEWFDVGLTRHSSRSDARKAASAQIAKIPFELAAHIARCFPPVIAVCDGWISDLVASGCDYSQVGFYQQHYDELIELAIENEEHGASRALAPAKVGE